MAAICLGQAVEAADESGEKMEGWMDAMIMNYTVDYPAIFGKMKPRDQVMATVYDGDFALHKVRIMAKNADAPPSKK